MNWISVDFRLSPFSDEIAELIIAAVEDYGFETFEIEEPYVKAYISQKDYNHEDMSSTIAQFPGLDGVKVDITDNFIKGENWNALWESNFPPVIIDGECTIKASFHKDLPLTPYTIIIDPKMAFGTGHHNTTHLMVSALLNESVQGKKVLDMGCGTGILAILAAMKGAASPVDAIDIDPIAVESVIENAKKNGVGGLVRVIEGDSTKIDNNRRYDVILANINRNIILNDICRYAASIERDGALVLSGFYEDDADMIVAEASKYSLAEEVRIKRENWMMIKLKKV